MTVILDIGLCFKYVIAEILFSETLCLKKFSMVGSMQYNGTELQKNAGCYAIEVLVL
jgi:hypothetical protein